MARSTLRGRLVEPLDLTENIDTILVSPEGPLCYLPFGALSEVQRAGAINVTQSVGKAPRWLVAEQNSDGGWAGVKGAASSEFRGEVPIDVS